MARFLTSYSITGSKTNLMTLGYDVPPLTETGDSIEAIFEPIPNVQGVNNSFYYRVINARKRYVDRLIYVTYSASNTDVIQKIYTVPLTEYANEQA